MCLTIDLLIDWCCKQAGRQGITVLQSKANQSYLENECNTIRYHGDTPSLPFPAEMRLSVLWYNTASYACSFGRRASDRVVHYRST
jgi:hypothetical protein